MKNRSSQPCAVNVVYGAIGHKGGVRVKYKHVWPGRPGSKLWLTHSLVMVNHRCPLTFLSSSVFIYKQDKISRATGRFSMIENRTLYSI